MKENIVINPYKIDHIVLNVGEKYHNSQEIIENIRSCSLPYEPKKGKFTKGFKVSNLWTGKEYFEMVNIKSQDGGGWISEWVSQFHNGHRGIICLFFDTKDIDKTVRNLKNLRITQPERLNYKFFFKLISISAKWRNAYLPFFEKVPLQLGFQQVDTEKLHENLYLKMKPNSEINGITGIKSIEIYGPFTEMDFEFINEAFEVTYLSPSHILLKLEDEQSIHFIKDNYYHSKVYLKAESPIQNSFNIENVEIIM